jgi:hypothetical protein
MAVKLRNSAPEKTPEQFVNDMADKPFGVNERVERITMCLEGTIFDKIDDIVRKRKRNKEPNRTISAFIREALDDYMTKNKI